MSIRLQKVFDVELHRFSLIQPSPISFGPSTPVQSASAAPAGLLGSLGGMSDWKYFAPPGLLSFGVFCFSIWKTSDFLHFTCSLAT